MGSVTHNAKQDFVSGEINIDEEGYQRGRKALTYVSSFEPYIRSLQGKKGYMHSALLFCYRSPNVDNAYLLDKYSKLYGRITPIANTMQAVIELEAIYNHNIRGRERVYLKSEFEQYVRAAANRNRKDR